jgi:hypothetical protein
MFPGGMPAGMQGVPAAEPPQAGENGRMVDLSDKIDKSECYARNEAASFPWSNLFIGDSRLGCKSDADEQLIIHISFNEFVKVRNEGLWPSMSGMPRVKVFDH